MSIALVPVIDEGGDVGLLLTHDDTSGQQMLPTAAVACSDVTWEAALVRAVGERTGLTVRFDQHVDTVSCPDAHLSIFGQTHPVRMADLRHARDARVGVLRPHELDGVLDTVDQRRVVSQWFAERARSAGGERRCGVTGRRAADAAALADTDLAGAVRAVHELVAQGADLGDDRYARTLLDRTVDGLLDDQRARWGERADDLLLAFLWDSPRDRLPVDELFERAAHWAHGAVAADPSACFAEPAVDHARAWLDGAALARALGQVMAPVHRRDPVGVVRSLLGFGRFGRLEARLHGGTAAALGALDLDQWEQVYAEVGARCRAALTPQALDPDALVDGLAAVLAATDELVVR